MLEFASHIDRAVSAAQRPGTVERAFQLARTGECASIIEIERRLRAEDYEHATDHLDGPLIRAQLRSILASPQIEVSPKLHS